MSEREPGWKQALREPNAAGWIGLMILVVAIGFGALYFGGGRDTSGTAPSTNGQLAH